jgi:maltose alpha-D-glucosyltransferase / alpha-amylase
MRHEQHYEPGWYKDAIIYQLHVKAFFDSNDDGIGDFVGLTSRLDYLQVLGVDTIWLLPFYPSPLKDDGYDIADYRGVHPSYGTMRDFRAFVREAHERDIRVVTELVINHTSDQHPWFQRARRAKPGSVYHNYYVWSDDDRKYAGTRIIFTDTEISNWTFDPIAKRYYWHRFFSHQPDLNFDNPRVFDEIVNVMRFWFDTGIDGMRLDAIPYLCEREGTSNENLPETHAVIKRLRAVLDREYPDRFFLAEANQWPEDVRAYFGDGDECHMAFHFPLMPRMFMSIASRDRYPIYDIMRQTPAIPENCQWAIFLRNHDEMTLEMVTDRERAFMYSVYASDLRARVNVGIRRRLAPLMENDRRKIELMTSLLFSMPGTPIVYYGDELGMGDNIFLGDRDGVRTPMQWSLDRNGGFSRADAQRLYLPIIQDPVYGYFSVNAEAQQRSPSSLLNWMKRVIAVRKAHRVFGRGTLTFLYPENRKVLAYLREFEGEVVLCVVNLADVSQAVELDLGRFVGRVPIEMLGWSEFPKVSNAPYVLTLPAHSFFWFSLAEAEVPAIEAPAVMLPEYFTVVLRYGHASMLREPGRATLERDVFPRYLPTRRWFAAKNVTILSTRLVDVSALTEDSEPPLLLLTEVQYSDGKSERYLLTPGLAFERAGDYPPVVVGSAFARCRRGPREGLIYDASMDDKFWTVLADSMRANERVQGQNGTLFAQGETAFGDLAIDPAGGIRRLQGEQSNTSAIVGDKIMLKIYRRLHAGIHPEIEMSGYLARAGYKNTPKLLGSAEYVDDETSVSTAVAIAHEYVLNQGDGWSMSMTFLKRFLTERHEEGDINPLDVYDRYASMLARRLAEMHAVLAAPTEDPAFKPEPVERDEILAWAQEIRANATAALDLLARIDVPANSMEPGRALLAQRDALLARIDEAARRAKPTVKTRIHGDFHLGQVLVVVDDVLIVDLEGEVQVPFEQRRRKHPQLRDVAGAVRSFDYAAVASLSDVGPERADDIDRMTQEITSWKERAVKAFLSEYEAAAGSIDFDLLALFLIAKAAYELDYEIKNRPLWMHIPIRGLLEMLEPEVAAP